MQAPAIKGTALIGLVEDLKQDLESGGAAADAIRARLEADDLAVLEDGKLSPSEWVPLDRYERMSEALYAARGAGRGRAAFNHERGRGAAQRLIDGGIYQQLDFKARADASGSLVDLVRDTRLRLSLMAGLLNRGTAHVEGLDAERCTMRIEVHDAGEVPECLGETLSGFMERCAEEGGERRPWRARRPSPDVIALEIED
ncbi:MAG: hypothetical protein ACQGVK_00265 [Myxococcota bacterium]